MYASRILRQAKARLKNPSPRCPNWLLLVAHQRFQTQKTEVPPAVFKDSYKTASLSKGTGTAAFPVWHKNVSFVVAFIGVGMAAARKVNMKMKVHGPLWVCSSEFVSGISSPFRPGRRRLADRHAAALDGTQWLTTSGFHPRRIFLKKSVSPPRDNQVKGKIYNESEERAQRLEAKIASALLKAKTKGVLQARTRAKNARIVRPQIVAAQLTDIDQDSVSDDANTAIFLLPSRAMWKDALRDACLDGQDVRVCGADGWIHGQSLFVLVHQGTRDNIRKLASNADTDISNPSISARRPLPCDLTFCDEAPSLQASIACVLLRRKTIRWS